MRSPSASSGHAGMTRSEPSEPRNVVAPDFILAKLASKPPWYMRAWDMMMRGNWKQETGSRKVRGRWRPRPPSQATASSSRPHDNYVLPMNSSNLREHLRETRFLTGLTDTAIHQLAKLVTRKSYAGNQLIFEEGGPREVAAIIHTGAVAIEKSVNGRPVRLVTLGPGDSVGEGLL